MNTNYRLIFFLILLLLTACAGQENPIETATPAPWDPLPDDAEMQRAEIELAEVEIISLENHPSQFSLRIEGALPTPCHLLRVAVTPPEDQSSLEIEVYSIVDPDEICIQVLEPFAVEIPLEEGEYQVILNNKVIGEVAP